MTFCKPKFGKTGAAGKRALTASVSVAALAALSAAVPAQADPLDWTGATDNDWFIGSNWNTGNVPTVADDVTIDDGAAMITQPGAQADNVTVGDSGSGNLIVMTGGTLHADHSLYLGYLSGSEGGLTVDGAGSSIVLDADLIAGVFGKADIVIMNGGKLSTNGSASGFDGDFAAGVGSSAETLVSLRDIGSMLQINGGFQFGVDGKAEMIATDGAQVILGGTGTYGNDVGVNAGGSGLVTLIGDGTLLSTDYHLTLGKSGVGGLNVLDGADASVTGSTNLGSLADGAGYLGVAGAGSTFTSKGGINVGGDGSGHLYINSGGVVNSNNGSVAVGAGSVGEVVIDGAGSKWTLSSFIDIGDYGDAYALIKNGGLLEAAGPVTLGWGSGGTSFVGVSGVGSTLSSGDSIYVGINGQARLVLTDGGSAQAATSLMIGNSGLLTIGGEIAPMAPGTISTPSLEFLGADGRLQFQHTGTNYAFDAPISGWGSIDHYAGVTKLTGDSSNFKGATVVHGGSLYVNGALGGLTSVMGGLLGGSGYLGNVAVGAGGSLAPGNSIGTLNAGDVTFAAGSTYVVEVDGAGNSDLLNASGTVTISGGTISIVPYPDFAFNTTYTVITAAGGVSGTFDNEVVGGLGGSIFITPQVSYDANNVYLTLAKQAFVTAALTANQQAAANGIDSTGGGAIYDAILGMASSSDAQAAFDALSGEAHASIKSALINDSRFVREAQAERLRLAGGDSDKRGLWTSGFIADGRINGDGNAARLDGSDLGVFLGIDTPLGDDLRLGALAGYGHASWHVDPRGSKGDADSFHLGVYGGADLGRFAARFGTAMSWHAIHLDRNAAFTGFAGSTQSRYSARTGQVFGEIGYKLDAGKASVEPFANLAYVHHKTKAFAETGSDAALSGAEGSTDATFSTLGLRGASAFDIGNGRKAEFSAMVGWRHGFGDLTPAQNLHFDGGDEFSVSGTPIGKNAVALEAGLRLPVSASGSIGLSYSGQIGSGMADHAAKASFSIRF